MHIKIRGLQNIQNKNKNEKKLRDFISMLIVSIFFVNISAILSDTITILSGNVSFVAKVLMAFFWVRAIPVIIRRVTKEILILGISSILITCLNILFFPNTITWFRDTMFTYYTMCLSSFIVCGVIKDFTQLKQSILKISRFLGCVSLVILLVSISGVFIVNANNYSMGFGYASVLPSMCLIYSFFENKKWYDLLWTISLVSSILVLGSRGPLLGIGLFGAYFAIRFLVQRKKYLLIIMMAVLFFFLLIFYEHCFLFIVNFFGRLGINSRTLVLMMNDIISDSGRSKLYDMLLEQIILYPFQIRGINAEYMIIGGYAHNIIIELLYQFGVIIGGIAIIYIFRQVVKTLSIKEVDDKSLIIWMFAFSSITQLMMSSSLWINQNFWIWLSLIL